MADNPYGDAELDVIYDRQNGMATGQDASATRPSHSPYDDLDRLIESQATQLRRLVAGLREENAAKDEQLHDKEEEIRRLKDELELMKKKYSDLQTRAMTPSTSGSPSPRATGSRLKSNICLFRGMEATDTLYTFIDKKLRPDKTFNTQCSEIINKLIPSLQARGSPFNIKRIVKSGSLGKGTHVRNRSDIDLIIFFNGYNSVQELKGDMEKLLKKLQDYIQKDWSDYLIFKDLTPFSVQFFLKIQDGDNHHEVDLLPAYDITQSQRPLSEIYGEMKPLKKDEKDYYATCFSPLQLEFVSRTDRVSTPGKVKDLIRLLKYWAKDEDVPIRSYFLELLVVKLWRDGGKKSDIILEDSLYQILVQLENCKDMEIAFDDNYQYRDYRPDIKKPYLLDPANPFRNVAPVSQRETDTVIRKARVLLQRGWE